VKRKLLAKFHQNPSLQEIPINFSLFPPHRSFFEFFFQKPFGIWGSLYKESSSLSQINSNPILFQIFGAREGPVWIESSLGAYKLNLIFFESFT
jgi:hypothetical protein